MGQPRLCSVWGKESAVESLAAVAAASAAAYQWKLSKLHAHRRSRKSNGAPALGVRRRGGWSGRTDVTKRAAATVVSAEGDDEGDDEELTDRLLIGWHSLPPSLFGLLKCAPRMNGANSGQRSKREKCEQTEAAEEAEDISFPR